MPEVLDAGATALELSALVGQIGAVVALATAGLLVLVIVLLTLAAVATRERRH